MSRLRRFAAALPARLAHLPPSLLWDVLVLAGTLLCSAGLWLAWPPLGLIAPGLSLVAVGILGARHAH
jgi:hypothetical protein